MSDKAVYRTALATLGLLKSIWKVLLKVYEKNEAQKFSKGCAQA